MNMETQEMLDWFVEYRKYRDLMFRKINSIESLDFIVKISLKNGTSEFAKAFDNIIDSFVYLKNFSESDVISCIVENKKISVKCLIDNWSKFIKYKNLTILFVNQDSLLEKKWIIKPYVHDRITEKSSLKIGINSMASNVDFC